MSRLVQQLVALNHIAREGRFLDEGWASSGFKTTYELALKACRDLVEHSMGVHIGWYPEDPDQLTVYRTNLATEQMKVLRRLPLMGALGQALRDDLQRLAVAATVEVIRLEREQALLTEATARIEQLLRNAPQPASVMP